MDFTTLALAREYTKVQTRSLERSLGIQRKIGSTELMRTSIENEKCTMETNSDLGELLTCYVNHTFGLQEHLDRVDVSIQYDGENFSDLSSYTVTGVSGAYILGNRSLAYPDADDTGEDFLVIVDLDQNKSLLLSKRPGTHKVGIYGNKYLPVPIDPKYIPAMDSITLNGADGKQYKVVVDASGALTATVIE